MTVSATYDLSQPIEEVAELLRIQKRLQESLEQISEKSGVSLKEMKKLGLAANPLAKLTEQARRLRKELAGVAQAGQGASGVGAVNQFAAQISLNSDDPKLQNEINKIKQKLQDAISGTETSANELVTVFEKIQRGADRAFDFNTPGLKRAEETLRSILSLTTKVEQANREQIISPQSQQLFNSFNVGLTPQNVTALAKVVNGPFATAFKNVGVSADKVKSIVKQIQREGFATAQSVGLSERAFKAIVPVARQIVALTERNEVQLDKQVQTAAKLLDQRVKDANALKTITGLTRQLNAAGQARNFQGASASQQQALIASYDRLIKQVQKYGLTLKQVEAIQKKAAAGQIASVDRVENEVIQSFRKIQAAEAKLGETPGTKKLTGQLSKLSSFQGILLRIFEFQVLTRTFFQISSLIGQVNRELFEFQLKISEIRTIAQDNQLAFENWAKGLREVSSEFGINQLEVAEAAYQALSNQVVKGAETFDFLGQAAAFARVNLTSLNQAVNFGSSVINAYRLNVEEAEKIFAVFSKAVELGRFRIEEISGTIGRVLPTAKQLGISYEEIAAILAETTKQGVPVSEAMTLINNVILKLIKPSERLSELFSEWGVTSGGAAIQTFGLVGTLQKLESAVGNSPDRLSEIADVFTRLRAIRGGAIFLDTGFIADVERDLGIFDNVVADFQRKQEIAFESTSFTLQQATQQIRNSLAEGFSTSLLEGLAGGLESNQDAIKTFTASINALGTGLGRLTKFAVENFDTIVLLVEAYVGFKVVGQINKVLTGTITTFKNIATAATTGAASVNTFKLALGSLQVLAAVGVAVYLEHQRALNRLSENLGDAADNLIERLRESSDETVEAQQGITASLSKQTSELATYARDVNSALASVKADLNSAFVVIAELPEVSGDAFDDATDAADALFGSFVKERQKELDDLLRQSETLQQRLASLTLSQERKTFLLAQSFRTDEEQLAANQARAGDLTGRTNAIIQQISDAGSLKEIDELGDQAGDLVDELNSLLDKRLALSDDLGIDVQAQEALAALELLQNLDSKIIQVQRARNAELLAQAQQDKLAADILEQEAIINLKNLRKAKDAALEAVNISPNIPAVEIQQQIEQGVKELDAFNQARLLLAEQLLTLENLGADSEVTTKIREAIENTGGQFLKDLQFGLLAGIESLEVQAQLEETQGVSKLVEQGIRDNLQALAKNLRDNALAVVEDSNTLRETIDSINLGITKPGGIQRGLGEAGEFFTGGFFQSSAVKTGVRTNKNLVVGDILDELELLGQRGQIPETLSAIGIKSENLTDFKGRDLRAVETLDNAAVKFALDSLSDLLKEQAQLSAKVGTDTAEDFERTRLSTIESQLDLALPLFAELFENLKLPDAETATGQTISGPELAELFAAFASTRQTSEGLESSVEEAKALLAQVQRDTIDFGTSTEESKDDIARAVSSGDLATVQTVAESQISALQATEEALSRIATNQEGLKAEISNLIEVDIKPDIEELSAGLRVIIQDTAAEILENAAVQELENTRRELSGFESQ